MRAELPLCNALLPSYPFVESLPFVKYPERSCAWDIRNCVLSQLLCDGPIYSKIPSKRSSVDIYNSTYTVLILYKFASMEARELGSGGATGGVILKGRVNPILSQNLNHVSVPSRLSDIRGLPWQGYVLQGLSGLARPGLIFQNEHGA